jgi:hypothetical protein
MSQPPLWWLSSVAAQRMERIERVDASSVEQLLDG